MATPRVSDLFTRANSGTLGANWTKLSAFSDIGVTSNQAKASVAGDTGDGWTGAGWTSRADQYVDFTVGASGGGAGNGDGGPTIRSNLTDTFYLCDVADNTAVDRGLYKCVSGGFTQIVATFAVVTTGDVVRIEAQGTALKAYLNSVQQQSQSDSAIDGTTVGGVIPGLFLSKLGLTAETWAAGDFVTDPLTLPAPVSRFPKFRLRGGARS